METMKAAYFSIHGFWRIHGIISPMKNIAMPLLGLWESFPSTISHLKLGSL